MLDPFLFHLLLVVAHLPADPLGGPALRQHALAALDPIEQGAVVADQALAVADPVRKGRAPGALGRRVGIHRQRGALQVFERREVARARGEDLLRLL